MTSEVVSRRPLRLWPGVIAVVIQWVAFFIVPNISGDAGGLSILIALVLGLLIPIWWLFFSRARWSERLGALAIAIAGLLAVQGVVHESISGGMMRRMPIVIAFPILSLALVAGAVASRRLEGARRWLTMAGAILLACGMLAIIRTEGITGGGGAVFRLRWSTTAEERLLAQAGNELPPSAPAAAPASPAATSAAAPAAPGPGAASASPSAAAAAASSPAAAASDPAAKPAETATPTRAGNERSPTSPASPTLAGASASPSTAVVDPPTIWPGFRGHNRDSIVRGTRIETDWTKAPPVELWRRKIGPGWSSFAVRGDVLYTQEQRGEDEVVACYRIGTGAPVWTHRDAARFWESNAGAGPRATPTISDGRVYTCGATGIVNALDARSGAAIWTRNATADTGGKTPYWGFSSSPLVFEDLVIVHAGALVAYDRATGTPRWSGSAKHGSYSSPHLMTIDGVPQIVQLTASGATSVSPSDGSPLWEFKMEGTTIVQPALMPQGDLLVTTSDAMGGVDMHRIAIARGPSGWTVSERWSSRGLKPYFNDYVIHKNHAYGFDGSILACIDVETGTRKWKGGRYGHGQLVLLADQDLLLVLSEDGELALVKATPDGFSEVARVPAIEGKTWNHPVLAGDVLLARNGEEMAAFRLTITGR